MTATKKRWRVYDGDDSYYVECETEEEAILLYRKQWKSWVESRKEDTWWWENYGSKVVPKDEDDLEILVVGQEEHKWGPRPACCSRINQTHEWDLDRGPAVQLRVTRRNPETGDYYTLVDPHWIITKTGDEISFCPFCGTKLPEVERLKNPPQPLWDGDDDYCGTCEERNRCCECNPPWAAYRIK